MEHHSPERASRPSPQPRAVTSPWAIASLMCSAVVVCPLATVMGPLLGLKAFAEIRARPGLKGVPIAVAGIVLGLVVTLVWIAVVIWLNVAVRQPILAGPEPQLQSGFRGNIATFKEGFTGRGAIIADDYAVEFINELTRRYGPFYGMEIAPAADAPPEDDAAALPDERLVAYIMSFERGPIEAEAAFVPFENMRPVGKWRWIRIKDDELGDLRYPPKP